MTATQPDRLWEGLTAAQADGLACVVYGVDYLDNPARHVPVGRSVTSSLGVLVPFRVQGGQLVLD